MPDLPEQPLPERFQLLNWRVNATAGEMRDGGRVVRVPPRLMQLLQLLAARPRDTLAREELIDALWPRGHVNEEALSRAVNELRALLGDDAREPRFIQTVPKRGYRLIAPVEPLSAGVPRSRWRPVLLLAAVLAAGGLAWWWAGSRDPASPVADALAAAQRLSATPGLEYHAEISPDGDWVAQVVARDGVATLQLLLTAQPESPRDLVHSAPRWSPVFSPDGSTLAAIETGGQCRVVLLPLSSDGAERTVLGDCLLTNASPLLDFSPDGEWLALVGEDPEDGTAVIFRQRLADGERQQLTRHGDPYAFDTRPRFSPDGRWLAFTRGTQSVRELYVLDLDNPADEPRALTHDQQYVDSFDWMPDGRALVVGTDRAGHRALWRLTPDGGWTLLGARDAQMPSVADDGRIAFLVTQWEANLWPVDMQTGDLGDAPMAASTKYDSNPAWSPDGSTVAFTSNRSGIGAIWLADADGGNPRPAYQPPDGRAVGPHWIDGGRALLATEYRPGAHRIIRITLEPRGVTPLEVPGRRPYGAMQTGDGRWLFYQAGDDPGGVYLWRAPADDPPGGGRWLDRPVDHFLLADDGWLYFTPSGEPALWRARPDDAAAAEQVLEFSPPWARSHWTVRGGMIYHAGQDGVYRSHPGSGASERVTEHLPSALPPTLAVHPTEPLLLMARTDRAESDLFLARP